MDNIFRFDSLDIDTRSRLCSKGAVLWFTGLSGSGKTTVASIVERMLLESGIRAYLLDGDNLRSSINSDLGFSDEDRKENIRRIGCVAALFAHSGAVCLVSAISPFAKDRDRAKKECERFGCPFIEIFIDTKLSVCTKRDPKGLYKRALAGEIKDFTGISSPYEAPENPDILIKTEQTTAEEAARIVIDYTKTLLSLRDITEFLCVTAKKAGEVILQVYGEDFAVMRKEDDTPLTRADLAADEVIRKELEARYPDIAILSEESADDPKRLKNPRCFIVDPLDGTKEFVKRNGEFTVNIGFTYFGKSIAGVIYAPALGKLYYAAKGEGAYEQSNFDDFFRQKNAIRVSDKRENLRVVTSRSHLDEQTRALLERNKAKIGSTIGKGSSLKGCLIASSQADVYYRIGCTMEWDTCAMQCIVEQAGGVLLQGDNTQMRYNRENTVNEKGFYILNSIENKFS
ncbi:MAG: putative adenylyl-sulfate kinase [Firmicutes bacterium ADurb.Bin300]|nr:MAG: putative adenylyl-sulfate kinase [Firmicutes bacterium ADurb.Bin300]